MIISLIVTYLVVASVFCGILETRKNFDSDDYFLAIFWPIVIPIWILAFLISHLLYPLLVLPLNLGRLIGKTKFMQNLLLAVLIIGPASPLHLWREVENKLSRMPASELCDQSNIDLAYETGVQLSFWTNKYLDKKYLAKLVWTNCGPNVRTKEY